MTLASSPKRPTPGRKRRFAGWGLVSLAALCSAAMLLPAHRLYGVASDRWFVRMVNGHAYLCIADDDLVADFLHECVGTGGFHRAESREHIGLPAGVKLGALAFAIVGKSSTQVSTGGGFAIGGISVWLLSLIVAAPGVTMLAMARTASKRARSNACKACGYSLIGLSSAAACPECGSRARRASEGEAE